MCRCKWVCTYRVSWFVGVCTRIRVFVGAQEREQACISMVLYEGKLKSGMPCIQGNEASILFFSQCMHACMCTYVRAYLSKVQLSFLANSLYKKIRDSNMRAGMAHPLHGRRGTTAPRSGPRRMPRRRCQHRRERGAPPKPRSPASKPPHPPTLAQTPLGETYE